MFLKEQERNALTGILGTIAFHLLVLVCFLVARLEKVKTKHQEPMLIEFDKEVYKTIKQIIEEKQIRDLNIKSLAEDNIKNIAVNTAQIEKDISTEEYIEKVKDELGIEELNQQLDISKDNDPVLDNRKKESPKTQQKKQFYKGPTRISYSLAGRTDRYMHLPVYKCQGHGKIVVDIVVNPKGEVINSSVASTTTSEECVIQTALESARVSLFNSDLKADPRQKGTITYEFVAQ